MKCANSRVIRVVPLVLGLFALTDSWGQTSSSSLTCKPEILVGITSPDGQLIRGLSASSFTATNKKRTIPIEAADYDRGGRRIVFVIDRGSHMNEAAQALARAVVNRVLSSARPQDSFGLITAGPSPMRIPLGTSASDLLGRLAAADSRNHSAERTGVLDAIAESANWFQTSQRGDALYLLSGDDDFKDSKAKYSKTLQILQHRGIRVFAMLFGYINLGTYYFLGAVSPNTGQAYSTGSLSNIAHDEEDLNNLTYRSGGYLSVENTHDDNRQYKLNGDRTKEVAQIGWQLYGGIAETYVLHVNAPIDGLNSVRIRLAKDVSTKVPGVVVVQSINFGQCNANPATSDSCERNTEHPARSLAH